MLTWGHVTALQLLGCFSTLLLLRADGASLTASDAAGSFTPRPKKAWSAVARPMRCVRLAVQGEGAAEEEPCVQLGGLGGEPTQAGRMEGRWHGHMKRWSQPGPECLKFRSAVSQLLLIFEKAPHLLLSWLCPWGNLVNFGRNRKSYRFPFGLSPFWVFVWRDLPDSFCRLNIPVLLADR